MKNARLLSVLTTADLSTMLDTSNHEDDDTDQIVRTSQIGKDYLQVIPLVSLK